MRSYKYFDNAPQQWVIMDSIKDEKEYPYCNEMLHWLKGVGYREYAKRAERRRQLRLALRVFKVWRYPHYAAVVMRRLFRT